MKSTPFIDTVTAGIHPFAFEIVLSEAQVTGLGRLRRTAREGARDVLERILVEAFKQKGIPLEEPPSREPRP